MLMTSACFWVLSAPSMTGHYVTSLTEPTTDQDNVPYCAVPGKRQESERKGKQVMQLKRGREREMIKNDRACCTMKN